MRLTSIAIVLIGFALIAAILVMLIRVRKLPPKPFVYSRWQDFPIWLRGLGIFTFVNFFVFCSIASTHGGDAWNGYMRAGRYFLGYGGTYTEVPRGFWTYSYYHVLAVWISFAATFIAAAWDTNRKSNSKV